jgi:hypothetical protein
MYAAAQAAGEGAPGAAGAGPDFTKDSGASASADDGVVDAEVVDEGPAEESK